MRRQRGPGRARRLGRGHGAIDILFTGLGDGYDGLAVERIDHRDLAARRGVDPATAYEQTGLYLGGVDWS